MASVSFLSLNRLMLLLDVYELRIICGFSSKNNKFISEKANKTKKVIKLFEYLNNTVFFEQV